MHFLLKFVFEWVFTEGNFKLEKIIFTTFEMLFFFSPLFFIWAKENVKKTFWQLEKKSISLKYMFFQEEIDGNFKEK